MLTDQHLAAAPAARSTTASLRQQLANAEQTAARIREELDRAEWIEAFDGGETAT